MNDPAQSPDKPDRKASTDAQGVALLSCELCSKRKIRCDKRQPCAACVKAGKECVPVVRARLPRGRRGGRKEANTELRNRVRRLENLVQSLGGNNSDSVPSGFASLGLHESDSSSPSLTASIAVPPTHSDDVQVSSPSNTSDTDISRLLGSTVWTQLSNELSGLRTVLETRDDDDEFDQNLLSNVQSRSEKSDSMDSPINFDQREDKAAENVSTQAVQQFMDVYSYNVHSVFKVVHMPTFRHAVETGDPYMGFTNRSFAFQALRSAAFYVSICSLNEARCLSSFGESKEVLRERWRTSTEHHLRAADITNNHSIITFAALVVYAAAFRTHNNGPRTWTLMGLATRIAYSLQLHREDAYASLTFYQAQIHRRCWVTLLGLDFQASFDRGSDPCIAANCYNVKWPENLNDHEFGPDTDKNIQWPDRHEFTEMTFSMIAAESQYLVRELSFVPAGEIDRAPKPIQHSWEVRQEAVKRLEERLHRKYLSHCIASEPLQFASLYLGKVIISNLQLYVVRAMQRHPAMPPPPPGSANVLLLASDSLEMKERFYHNTTNPWHWLFEGYVDWHPLATILAELCSPQTDSQLVERAWKAADKAFAHVAARVAEGTSGTLFQPIKKLMRMAQQRRAMEQPKLYPTSQAQLAWPVQSLMPVSSEAPLSNAAMSGMNTSMSMDFDFNINMMDDSWMNWQGFVDDLASQNSYIGWTSNLGGWPQLP